jgi:hypothetical protein
LGGEIKIAPDARLPRVIKCCGRKKQKQHMIALLFRTSFIVVRPLREIVSPDPELISFPASDE